MHIQVRTLGGLQVLCDGRVVEELTPQRRLLALLVFLAVEREATRERLMGILWGDKAPARARHSLNQAIYALRQALGGAWLRSAGDKYVATPLIEMDLADFERLVRTDRPTDALALYKGPFLEHFSIDIPAFDHWVAGRRAAAGRSARALFRRSVDTALAGGDVQGAVEAARRWVAIDPFDDEAQHRLIEAIAASGDRAGALRHFEQYQIMLAEDDLRPLDETMDLVAALRRGELPVSGAAASSDKYPRDAAPASAGSRARREAAADDGPTSSTGTVPLGGVGTAGPRLVRILEGGKAGESYPLSRMRTRIGSGDADLVFVDDDRLAPLHATILVRTSKTGPSEGRFILRDEGSAFGVFIRLRSPWPFQPGDEVLAGNVVIRLEQAKPREGTTDSAIL